jgi:hypothetical protein
MTPERIEVVPGSLAAVAWSVELTALGTPTSCWFFLTDGLAAHGWREVAVAAPGLSTDDPRTLDGGALQLLGTIFNLAEQGRNMGAGGFLEFKPPSPGGPTGAGFVDGRFFSGVGLPAGALMVFPLVGDETAAALSFGLSRVMARIGQHFRFYPCWPLWDLGRPAVGACAGDETSILRLLPKQLVPGLSVTWAPDRAVAHADIGQRNDLAKIVKQAPECCALLIPPNPAGDGMLV